MGENWEIVRWGIGIAVTVLLAFASLLIGAFWKLVQMMRTNDAARQKGDSEIHDQISSIRREFVSWADFDRHICTMAKDIREMRQEVRESTNATNQRLDKVIAALAKLPGEN